ncbi:hypothetical protein C5167_012139 [Papaver somniferum]|uniref:Uncharacterized protein n=1 Tax=Papaver somniferum TaxID=3469 RepID=A0A4Y7IYM4_PAPSO|nr:hypothetical protein C5167_012139 [Papaver somniferum]
MAGKGEGPAIGIDLGTTYSCVGVWQHDRVEIIANDQGNRTTPSYVAFTDTERLIGDSAKNQVAMNPVNTVFGKIFILFLIFFLSLIVLSLTRSESSRKKGFCMSELSSEIDIMIHLRRTGSDSKVDGFINVHVCL